MFKEPTVAMSPAQLPQQRLHAVTDLPERPAGFRVYCQWHDPTSEKDTPKGSPRKVKFLGSVEWAWGFRSDRWDAYYLNPRGKYWLLWIRDHDDNQWPVKFYWTLCAWGLRKGVSEKEAAVYLLQEAWAAEQRKSDIGWFLCINNCGLLSIPELCAIGRRVWPDGTFEDG